MVYQAATSQHCHKMLNKRLVVIRLDLQYKSEEGKPVQGNPDNERACKN